VSALIFVAAMCVGMVLARWSAHLPSLARIATPADPLET
jgi:uncharacterized protein